MNLKKKAEEVGTIMVGVLLADLILPAMKEGVKELDKFAKSHKITKTKDKETE